MSEQDCPQRWFGHGPHFWSVPKSDGWQECLFCSLRRQLVIVDVTPPKETTAKQPMIVTTSPERIA